MQVRRKSNSGMRNVLFEIDGNGKCVKAEGIEA